MEEKSIVKEEKKGTFFSEYVVPVAIGLLIVVFLRSFIFGLFYVPSGSMIPTLEVNDHVVVTKFTYHISKPKRGDIVVFNYPVALKESGEKIKYVKRLIGLPGEKIEIKNNQLYINDELIDEPYVASDTAMPDFSPIVLNDKEYFMMGDNRNHSNDSRYWGSVEEDLLVGKAQMIYWPLNRIGTLK